MRAAMKLAARLLFLIPAVALAKEPPKDTVAQCEKEVAVVIVVIDGLTAVPA